MLQKGNLHKNQGNNKEMILFFKKVHFAPKCLSLKHHPESMKKNAMWNVYITPPIYGG